jgi:O-antigen ligase
MLASTYLFQTSFKSVDILNSSVMTLGFLSLLSIEWRKNWRILYAAAAGISFIGVILTFHRTGWVAIIIAMLLLLLLSVARERAVLLRYGIRLVGIGIVLSAICIALIPLAQSIFLFFFARFLSSSNVSSDVSLLGRFVEWRYVIAQIAKTPILGVGFGGQYYMYGWLVGFSTMTGYTHNGYLLLLLKGGIVGFAAMMIAQIKFFILGIKLSRSPLLTDKEKVLAKVGMLALVILFIEMQTLGLFIHREILWYIGLIWGVFSVSYEKTLQRSSIQNALVE